MPDKRCKKDVFAKLTWSDLGEWAGQKILSRGKGYQRGKKVEALSVTADGTIVAWVRGEKRYATMVDVEDSELTSTCTCPYWNDCKHAVAALLEYLECLKKKTMPPMIADDDQRLVLLRSAMSEEGNEDYEEDESDADYKDEYDDSEEPSRRRRGAGNSRQALSYLDKLSKEQLIETLKELACNHTEVLADLERRGNLKEGSIKKVAKAIEMEIHALSNEPAWRNHWNGEGSVPDYSGVRKGMEDLLTSGHADEVISMGRTLLREGMNQVEMSDDDGETAMEISSCMDIVFRALSKSSLSPVEQMLWAVDAELKDEFEICSEAEHFWKQEHKPADWGELADRLMQQLKNNCSSEGKNNLRDYKRDRLSNIIIGALEHAGRHAEIIPLCGSEVVKTSSYQRLVDQLITAKRTEEAEQWIQKGISATQSSRPGIASGLRNTLRKIREKKGDWKTAAFLRSEDFFNQPSLATFRELKRTAERAGVWREVKDCAMSYLETGKIPSAWPLPKPALSDRRCGQFPDTETLIDIAIADKRTEDIIRWHERHRPVKNSWFASSKDEDVAKAIVDSHPEIAISIWKKLAEGQIAMTQPKAYGVAASHLNKIQRTFKKLGRDSEWQQYRSALRQANIRKRSFVEILDGISGKAIIDGAV